MRLPETARCARRATIWLVAGVAVAGLLSCVSDRSTGTSVDIGGCDAQLPSEAFGSTIVIIRDFRFTPAQVRVRPGTKVTWVNCGSAGSEAHTSTADAGAWSSPLLPPGGTFTRDFAVAGSLPYHCEPHPGMQGTVTVE